MSNFASKVISVPFLTCTIPSVIKSSLPKQWLMIRKHKTKETDETKELGHSERMQLNQTFLNVALTHTL